MWYDGENLRMGDVVKKQVRKREMFPLSLKDWTVFAAAMLAGSVLCRFLQTISTSDVHVPMIFVLIVLIISLSTDGYFYGILAAVFSVFAVNWAFTYPYMKLDFSIYGYPLTFLTMLAVGLVTSALATGLKEQQKLRIEAEREKTRANLLRAVSHDLRTSLTAISGSVTSVLEGKNMSEEEKTELLMNAKEDAEWLYRVVENLLSITRINGASQINTTDELLEEVIGEAVSNFKKRSGKVSLEVSIPEEPIFVPMDAMLIEQVLRNILENAVVHGKGLTTIWVSAENEGDTVKITIEDDGCGIDPRILGHLFDGSLEFEGPFGGDGNRFMGIGLAVCKTIIDAHSGKISAHNREDHGAVFDIVLPKAERYAEFESGDYYDHT